MAQNTANPLLIGLVEYLNSNSHVSDVKLQETKPANLQLLTSWEVKNIYSLPNDLRQFYLASNGFTLDWNVSVAGDRINIGHISINSVQKLCQLTAPEQLPLAELDAISNSVSEVTCPSFTTHNMFILTDIDCGRVCLCFEHHHGDHKEHTDNFTGVWLLDKTWAWHYLSDTFTHFFRLAICHLGLPEWPLLLTSYNTISPQHQAWYHMFIPNRLKMDQHDVVREVESLGVHHNVNVLDVNKVFRRSHDLRLPRDKKKSYTQKGTTTHTSYRH